MIHKDSTLFMIIVSVLVGLFLRLIVIDYKVRSYVKKNHKAYWEENTNLFITGGGRTSVFRIVKGLSDPQIDIFRKQFESALKHLIYCAGLLFLMMLIYVALLRDKV